MLESYLLQHKQQTNKQTSIISRQEFDHILFLKKCFFLLNHMCDQIFSNCFEQFKVLLVGLNHDLVVLIGCLYVLFILTSIYNKSQSQTKTKRMQSLLSSLSFTQKSALLGVAEELKGIWNILQGSDSVDDDENVEETGVVKRKREFLESRHGKRYGYSSCSQNQSQVGHIDTWRGKEFPSLIQPISLLKGEKQHKDNEGEHVILSKSIPERDLDIHRGSAPEAEVYLDYAGSALPSKSLLEALHQQSMQKGCQILGNPHSTGPAAARTHALIESTRKQVLDFFRADAGPMYLHGNDSNDSIGMAEDFHPGYDIIFTSSTTQGLRIVGENFDWSGEGMDGKNVASTLLYAHNSHTSVLGIREPAIAQGASFHCENLESIVRASSNQFDEWARCGNRTPNTNKLDSTSIMEEGGDERFSETDSIKTNHLLIIPLECNFDGTRIKTDVIQESRKSQTYGKWYTLLDIAKAASTSPINLKKLDPDFACVSFYKLFGAPTGIGALFVKRSSKHLLLSNIGDDDSTLPLLRSERSNVTKSSISGRRKRRHYFGGGSVDVVIPRQDVVHVRSSTSSSPLDSLVHGTMNFRNIVSLTCGMNEIHRLGGMDMIKRHVQSLAIETVVRLSQLRHSNGRPGVQLYGSWGRIQRHFAEENDGKEFESNSFSGSVENFLFHDEMVGPTIAFNVLRSDGSFVGYNEVSKLAALAKNPIQFRVGCFCNPGACAEAVGLSEDQVLNNYKKNGHVCGDHIDVIDGFPTGAIRISYGKDSIWEDMDSACTFLDRTFVDRVSREGKLSVTSTSSVQDNEGDEVDRAKTNKDVQLTQIYLFPIKSCAAMEVSRWKICQSSGKLNFDREFALVNSSGTALRLSQYPKMGLIRPYINVEESVMIVSAPGQPKIRIDLSSGASPSPMSQQIRVCGNKCGGTLWGSHIVSRWFSNYLGIQCWLARSFNGTDSSPIGHHLNQLSIAPVMNRSNFANEAPLLLISQTSVNYLNKVLKNKGSPSANTRHFRPNLVVATKNYGKLSNPEDTWKSIKISKMSKSLSVVGQCARCTMVDFDPDSGMKGKTLQALAEYRRSQGKITFGIFLRMVPGPENLCDKDMRDIWLEIGDELEINY